MEEALYRGSEFTLAKIEKNQFYSKCDRSPRNMPDWLHQATDEWFFARFGVKVRGGSVFCTGDYNDARIYGSVYRVQPLRKFKAYFSFKVNDLYNYFVENGLHVKRMSADEFWEIMDSLNYECTSILNRLNEAVAAKVEVMLYCEEYYAEKC